MTADCQVCREVKIQGVICDVWRGLRMNHGLKTAFSSSFPVIVLRISEPQQTTVPQSTEWVLLSVVQKLFYCYYLLFKAELELDFTQLIGFLTRGNLIITCLKLIFKP